MGIVFVEEENEKQVREGDSCEFIQVKNVVAVTILTMSISLQPSPVANNRKSQDEP